LKINQTTFNWMGM